jgi:predicted nucleic acid-binding Zn ribbon protein
MAQTIGSAIREWLRANGLEQKVQEHSVPGYWEEVVGEAFARHAKVERVDNGRLFVSVESAAWRTELMLRREEILQRLNERLGAEIVKEIIVR